jgi:hypothetical protein
MITTMMIMIMIMMRMMMIIMTGLLSHLHQPHSGPC